MFLRLKVLFLQSALLIFFLLQSCSFGIGEDNIVIQKTARQGNPSLAVEGFLKSKEFSVMIQTSLHDSDWFHVVVGDAEYTLLGSLKKESTSILAILELQDSDHQPIIRFELEASTATSMKMFANRIADELISQVFSVPGICSTKLAFVKGKDHIKEIWIANFNGEDSRQLTFNQNISVEPNWGIDNRFLLYTYYGDFSTHIMMINRSRNLQKRVTNFKGLNAAPAISHDGTRIAMILSKDGTVDLYVLILATGDIIRLTDSPAVEASPCWSPDDKTICYVSDHIQRKPMLYFCPSTGGNPEKVLSFSQEAVSPDWSSISNKICFSLRVGKTYTVAYIDVNANEPIRLVYEDGDWESPSWAPDGRHIVCSRSFNHRKKLYLVDSYYKKVFPLKENSLGDNTLPSYSYIYPN